MARLFTGVFLLYTRTSDLANREARLYLKPCVTERIQIRQIRYERYRLSVACLIAPRSLVLLRSPIFLSVRSPGEGVELDCYNISLSKFER